MNYLKESDVINVITKDTWASQLDGYGKRKHPSEYMVKLTNNKTYRVYACCMSNSGTIYIVKNKQWEIIDFDLRKFLK